MTSQQKGAYIALLFISAMVVLTYTQLPESEQSDAVIVGKVISFIFIIGFFLKLQGNNQKQEAESY